ncbi:MAG TPA: hypothetical protein VI636_15560 [Candidatus Angelobacter sp.]
MKSAQKYAIGFVYVMAFVALLFAAVPKIAAQQDSPPPIGDADDNFNPAPCDFTDQFYTDNGIDPAQVSGRFGSARQFGPPARNSHQANYVADTANCSGKDPTRRNFRILSTTGGYIDDQSGNATDFISLIGFLQSQNAFLQNPPTRTVGFINGGLEGVQQNPGIQISIGDASLGEAPGNTLRAFALQNIVSNFEAYPAIKQAIPTGQPFAGQLAPSPCGSLFGDGLANPLPTGTPCFSVASEATPNLREDWRFASNRNAMDGSDNNDPVGAVTGNVFNAPFGYFCDDLLGIWINTYFWFTHHAVGNPATGEQPDPICNGFMNQLFQMHGHNLDGTGVITTGNELNFLEGKDISPATPFGPAAGSVGPLFSDGEGCAREGQLDTSGVADFPAAVWDICPAIQDPRAGAIAQDAFLDSVRFSNGVPVDFRFNLNFASLQIFGVFFNELFSASQKSQVTTAAGSN